MRSLATPMSGAASAGRRRHRHGDERLDGEGGDQGEHRADAKSGPPRSIGSILVLAGPSRTASRLLPSSQPTIGSMVMMAARLRRDIAIVLVLKLALLTALYLMFFRGDQRPAVDAQLA